MTKRKSICPICKGDIDDGHHPVIKSEQISNEHSVAVREERRCDAVDYIVPPWKLSKL